LSPGDLLEAGWGDIVLPPGIGKGCGIGFCVFPPEFGSSEGCVSFSEFGGLRGKGWGKSFSESGVSGKGWGIGFCVFSPEFGSGEGCVSLSESGGLREGWGNRFCVVFPPEFGLTGEGCVSLFLGCGTCSSEIQKPTKRNKKITVLDMSAKS
jgi:hypothetical protein